MQPEQPDVRILYLGNNRLGLEVLRWLRGQGEEIVGLVVHPPARRQLGQQIVECSGLSADRVFDSANLHDPRVLEAVRSLRPELGLSVLFGCILRPELIALFPHGCANLHPALLPYNRGAYPNVWSIVDGTPAGVTLHFIDEGIDTGDIVAQRAVELEATDTGETLYRKLEAAALDLFQAAWPELRAGRAQRTPQRPGEGTYHRRADVARIDEVDLDRSYTARELINILRARTFSPYPGAYFRVGERRIFMRLQLMHEDELA